MDKQAFCGDKALSEATSLQTGAASFARAIRGFGLLFIEALLTV